MARDESSTAFAPGTPWSRGRDQVLRLITEGRVASVTPDGALAQRILERATGSLRAATTLQEAGMGADAFEKAYSAARLTASALLEHQGLRIPGRDGVGAVAAGDPESLVLEECGGGEAGGAVGLLEGIGAHAGLLESRRRAQAAGGAFEDALREGAVGRDRCDASLGDQAEHLVASSAPRRAWGERGGRLVTGHGSPQVRRRVGT